MDWYSTAPIGDRYCYARSRQLPTDCQPGDAVELDRLRTTVQKFAQEGRVLLCQRANGTPDVFGNKLRVFEYFAVKCERTGIPAWQVEWFTSPRKKKRKEATEEELQDA